ncbi:hypothetical protein G7Y89_g9250 [Cudoniella acicularis]|uniref:ATP-grasp domain-containing protein n=1 Tax=Cudoniella acicularis TaxID=354080 RepID=A0A8H4RIQ2_9HELO|nr:hypothetical protein G7Y89_g9250 [Cudoniella acicularis]
MGEPPRQVLYVHVLKKDPISVLTSVVSVECEWSYQKSAGKHGIRNLYIVPKLTIQNNDGQVYAPGHAVSLSNELHSLMTWALDLSKAPAIASFLERLLRRDDESNLPSLAAAFLTPARSGYVMHSKFMEYRLTGCELVSSTESFLSPLSEVKCFPGQVNDIQDVANALEAAIGAINFPISAVGRGISQLEHELEQRLAFSWLVSERVREQRVCIVTPQVNITTTKPRWETAAALGIKVVVLSSGSWWAEGCGSSEQLRESFISVDLTPDGELPQRIVQAVESCPHQINGIFTLTDDYLVGVAKAAEKLGLSTPEPTPFSIATNKYLTRKLLEPNSSAYFTVESLDDLETRLKSDSPVNFPVISKPPFGKASENVFKSDSVVELREAVVKTLASQKKSQRILVEPYADGPEVDANLVLRDGRLLYSEIVDDFPSPAELVGKSTGALFTETQTAVPSKLPKNEQDAVIQFMVATVQKMGFHTGIFHCEARVQNSSMEYALAPGMSGRMISIPDLQPATVLPTNAKPSVFLHEVNARIPGAMSSASTLISQGVDFFALQMLCAVADWPRYEALASPFLDDTLCNHVLLANAYVDVSPQLVKEMFPDLPMDQFDMEMIDSVHDPMPELLRRHADIARFVLRSNALVRSGHIYGGSKDTWIWALCAVICSPLSREHALQVAEAFVDVYKSLVKERDNRTQRR